MKNIIKIALTVATTAIVTKLMLKKTDSKIKLLKKLYEDEHPGVSLLGF